MDKTRELMKALPIVKNPHFRPWVQKTFPGIYDDSLTTLQMLGKIIHYLNEMNDQQDEIIRWVEATAEYQDQKLEFMKQIIKTFTEDMEKAFEEFKAEVIDSLMGEKVTAILEEWFKNGKLGEIINDEIFKNKADRKELEELNKKVESIVSGAPKGVYDTVDDLRKAFPEGDPNIYVVRADGKWYYWNGEDWIAGGVYQGTKDKVGSDDIDFNAVFPYHTDFLTGLTIEGVERKGRTIVWQDPNRVYTYDPSKNEKCVLFTIDPTKKYLVRTTGNKFQVVQGTQDRDLTYYASLPNTTNAYTGGLKETQGEKYYITNNLTNNKCLIVNTEDTANVIVTDITIIQFDPRYKVMLPKVSATGVDFINEGLNKFNKDSKDNLPNMIITAGGVLQPSQASNVTHAIKVKNGDIVRFYHDTFMGSPSGNMFKGGIMDKAGIIIASLNNDYPGIKVDVQRGFVEVTIVDTRADSIRFNYNSTNKDRWMVVVDKEYPSQFEPYAFYFDSSLKITKGQITDEATGTVPMEVIFPDTVYVTCNDTKNDNYKFAKARQYSTGLYLDHCVTGDIDKSARIESDKSKEQDKAYFFNNSFYDGNFLRINNAKDVDISSKDVQILSDKYKLNRFTVNQVSTKASITKTKKPFVLVIGDSQSQDVGMSPRYGNGENSYFGYLMKLFAMDRIDGGDKANEYFIKTLGTRIAEPVKFTYEGKDVSLIANSEGYASFCLYDIIHHPDRLRADQTSWDKKGLGDGTGTDFKNTPAQRDLFAVTNYPDDTVVEPINRFYDNAKTGKTKFSIKKWIERYRTCNDDGVKLKLGDEGVGTMVKDQKFIDEHDICTPTHIVINLGRNDYASSSVNAFITNMQYMIDEIKGEFPNMNIGICMTPDKAGTFFPERYSNILDLDRMGSRPEYDSAKLVKSNFSGKEAQGIYIIPLYFIQPTAWGKALQAVNMPESMLGEVGYNQDAFRRYRVLVDGPETHVGSQGHLAWGYQVYSWLKYALTK